MIGYLKGKVIYLAEGVAIIETNGIGFEVSCSSAVFSTLKIGEEGQAYVYTAVREDGIFLYGFIDMPEKNMFLKLISISGVGPKMAITILSNMQINELAVKIATNDVKGLATIKGLGKKTAERIILELREKVAEFENISAGNTSVKPQETPEDNDAIVALMSLGFTRAECVSALAEAKQKGAKNINELIAVALKCMR